MGVNILPYLPHSPLFLKGKINKTQSIPLDTPCPSSPELTELRPVFFCLGHVFVLSLLSYGSKTCNSIVTYIFKVYINGIILYIILCRLFFSLHIMSWRLIPIGTCWSSLFILTVINDFIVFIKQLIFLFPCWEQLGCSSFFYYIQRRSVYPWTCILLHVSMSFSRMRRKHCGWPAQIPPTCRCTHPAAAVSVGC